MTGSGMPACVPDESGHCAICADEGRIGEVVEASGAGSPAATGRVRIGDEIEEVSLALLDDVAPGEKLVVHLGFAIARLDEGGDA